VELNQLLILETPQLLGSYSRLHSILRLKGQFMPHLSMTKASFISSLM